MVHTLVEDYAKYDENNVKLLQILLSSSKCTCKPNLMKVIYSYILKTLLYLYKDPEKLGVLSLGPTEISAVNNSEATIHSGLESKPGIKLLGLNDKSKAALINKLSEVKTFN